VFRWKAEGIQIKGRRKRERKNQKEKDNNKKI
jgi:hypothetical protein